MPNVNKVVYGNDTLIDLTSDTVTPSDVLNSKSFHDASGTLRTGSADLSKYYSTDDTAETTLADDDYVPFYDTSATGKRKSLWSNIKSVLKTYFDTLYKGVNTHDNWEDVTNKPFENISNSSSSGLSVDSGGWLSTLIKKVGLRHYDDITSGEGLGYTQLWVNDQPASGGNSGIIEGTAFFQRKITLSTSTTVQATFTDTMITTDKAIEVYTGRYSGDVSGEQNSFPYLDMYTTSGSCVVTFPPFTSAVQIIVRIYVK